MTPEELASSKDAVRTRAYFSWLDAGYPDRRQLEFWIEAEREWIEHNYVPHRVLDGTRPQPGKQSSAVSLDGERQEPAPHSRRHRHT